MHLHTQCLLALSRNHLCHSGKRDNSLAPLCRELHFTLKTHSFCIFNLRISAMGGRQTTLTLVWVKNVGGYSWLHLGHVPTLKANGLDQLYINHTDCKWGRTGSKTKIRKLVTQIRGKVSWTGKNSKQSSLADTVITSKHILFLPHPGKEIMWVWPLPQLQE